MSSLSARRTAQASLRWRLLDRRGGLCVVGEQRSFARAETRCEASLPTLASRTCRPTSSQCCFVASQRGAVSNCRRWCTEQRQQCTSFSATEESGLGIATWRTDRGCHHHARRRSRRTLTITREATSTGEPWMGLGAVDSRAMCRSGSD
jgi:hypothetical protein